MTQAITLSAASLFELYKTEKEAMDDELNPFPTFAKWKVTCMEERTAEMVEATANLDTDFFIDMPTFDTKPKLVARVKKPVVKSKKKALTNMDKARIIFKDMFDKAGGLPVRKDVMDAFMKQLKVSKACASTYHHNIKQKYR